MAGGINLFAYVQNNPINYIDRNGLDWIDVQNMIVDISNKYELSKPDSVLYTPMSPDDMGKADRWKNIIELPREEFDRKLTEREFDALYQTIYHEMRHLNAPDWQESIDFFSEFFVDIGPFHLKIYQEELMVEPSEGLYEKNNCK